MEKIERIEGHKLEVKSCLVGSGQWFNGSIGLVLSMCTQQSRQMAVLNCLSGSGMARRSGRNSPSTVSQFHKNQNTCPLRSLCDSAAPQSERQTTNKNEKRQTRVAAPTHTSYATLLMWGESEEWEGQRGDSYPPMYRGRQRRESAIKLLERCEPSHPASQYIAAP